MEDKQENGHSQINDSLGDETPFILGFTEVREGALAGTTSGSWEDPDGGDCS